MAAHVDERSESPRRDDAVVIHLLGSGLVRLHELTASGSPLRLPYPDPLQRALDKISLRYLTTGARPPAGIAELVRWSHEPLGTWAVPFGGDELESDVLMSSGVPTRACQEWVLESANVEDELFENDIILEVRRICRATGRDDSYVAFRRTVIELPVLTELEFQRLVMSQPALSVLESVLRRCYPAAPAECVREGTVRTCADCDNLLVESPTGVTCANDRCPRTGPPRPDRVIAVTEDVRWLAGPLRAFIASPGRAELRIERELRDHGIDVDLWPNLDAYDLRLEFPDGEAWAVDVKDWSNPVRLASRLKPLPRDPDWTRAFVVPSREAVNHSPGYLAALRNRGQQRLAGTGTRICSERELVRMAKAKRGATHA